jgi:ATP-dependent 26S proteasome regulatory subunit
VKPSPFINSVDEYICAGYQSLAINTSELQRVESELFTLPAVYPYEAVLTWDCVTGLQVKAVNPEATAKKRSLKGKVLDIGINQPANVAPSRIASTSALAALKFSLDPDDFPFMNCVIIWRNLHAALAADIAVAQFWQTSVSDRAFNTLMQDTSGKTDPPETIVRRRLPIIIGTATNYSAAIQPTITHIEFELPDLAYMCSLFGEMDAPVRVQSTAALPDADSPEVIATTEAATRLLLGLSAVEASDALALCAVHHGNLCHPEILDTIEHEKVKILETSTALQYVERRKIGTEADVGGFADYITWVRKRRVCYTDAGVAAKLDLPRGALIIGVPGTAKSLVAKITARVLNLPLVRMDVGAIFGSLVGQSEQRMTDTIRTVEAMHGAVVLLDEVDKLWGGANEASGDSGVTRRVFGKFLTWMAEKQDGSFVIMTANRTDGLPPELLRKGRLDEIWYTDIPEIKERKQILGIHLRLRGLDIESVLPTDADTDSVLEALNGFVGAEIESAVVEARLHAFGVHGKAPVAADLIRAALDIRPLTVLDGANIQAIRDFCVTRARPVMPPIVSEVSKPLVGKRSVTARSAKNSN